MNAFLALLNREWLEHKDSFIWVPVVTAVILLVAAVAFSNFANKMIVETEQESSRVVDGTVHTDKVQRTRSLAEHIRAQRQDDADSNGPVDLKGFFIVPVFIISLFALVASTFDERSNASILFFKSMPISDWRTVVSKYSFIAWLAPAVALGCYLLVQLIFAMWSGLSSEPLLDFAGQGIGAFITLTMQAVAGYVLYGVWLLPIFAWFLFIGAWANRHPLLWAFGLPIGLHALERLVFDTQVLRTFVTSHMARGFAANPASDRPASVIEQLSALFSLNFIVGIVIGALLLAGAAYMRQTRNKI